MNPVKIWIAAFFALVISGNAQGQISNSNLFEVKDGTVHSMLRDGNTLYLGGEFTTLGLRKGGVALINPSSGQVDAGFPEVAGEVSVAISDGSGGWFIGGGFSHVGGLPRQNLARILADGSVAPWNPGTNSWVRALVLNGNVIYVGGEFTSIGGQSRNYLAQLDATTGAVLSWNPNPGSYVFALLRTNDYLYVGGRFTSIGGQVRNRIAAINNSSGAVTSWNPNSNNDVWALTMFGVTIYVGGFFSNIGGQDRLYLAALDMDTGLATAGFHPNPDRSVDAITVANAKIYVGGQFWFVNGQRRQMIAALDPTTGAPTTWNPNGSGGDGETISSIQIVGNTVYVAGRFTGFGTTYRYHLAALDIITGHATSWNPNPDNPVHALVVSSNVFAGGSFGWFSLTNRRNAAAINLTTGQPTAWDPNPDGAVWSYAKWGSIVYAGGDFTNIGGQSRYHIAALDATSGTATSWFSQVNGRPYALATDGSTIYVGGDFLKLAGAWRQRVGAVDATYGLTTYFDPGANGTVRSLLLSGTSVYVGGDFTTIGGQSRGGLAEVGIPYPAAVTSWNPGSNGSVQCLALSGSTLYAGGTFTTLGGASRSNVGALSVSSNTALDWIHGANGAVRSIGVSGSVYAGGSFTTAGGVTRNHIAGFEATTGQVIPWDANANNDVEAMSVNETHVYAGGSFTNIGGMPQYGVVDLIVDNVPPAAVANLAAHALDCETIEVTWTAPGDDGTTGTASAYDLRWAASAISTDSLFSAATPIPTNAPGPPGTQESALFEQPGVCGQNRFFAIKTRDEVLNWSSLAYTPLPTATPCPPPHLWCVSAARPREEGGAPPARTELGAPHPSPAQAVISLRYAIAADAMGRELDLSVFDVSGRRTAVLKSGSAETGRFDIRWDLTAASGQRVSPGLYFVRLRVGKQLITKTMIVTP